MCKVMEEAINENVQRVKMQTAVRMLEKGKISYSDISKYTELPLETVKALAEKYFPQTAEK